MKKHIITILKILLIGVVTTIVRIIPNTMHRDSSSAASFLFA